MRTLRRFMLAILIFAMTGTFVDMMLFDHYQTFWQKIPLVLLGIAALTLTGHLTVQNQITLRAFRSAMLLLILGGAAGIFFHVQASAEFHGELDSTASRWQLAWVVLHSKVPPTLAPGGLIQMGLIGLAATYRHPDDQRKIQQGDSR